MDAIAVTLATGGRYVGVAPLGTALTDAQAAHLRQLGHRTPIVATDADLAGRVAAERDYWILTPDGHDPHYARLPAGTDPAELLAAGRGDILAGALIQATPLADLLIDERLTHLPIAQGVLETLRVVAAQPSRQWETALRDIAGRLGLPADVLRPPFADIVTAWNQDPRSAAQSALADVNTSRRGSPATTRRSMRSCTRQRRGAPTLIPRWCPLAVHPSPLVPTASSLTRAFPWRHWGCPAVRPAGRWPTHPIGCGPRVGVAIPHRVSPRLQSTHHAFGHAPARC